MGAAPTRLPAATAYRAALVEQHLPLVHHIARRLVATTERRAMVDYDDLVSSGVEGLIAALDSFDPNRGAKFSTWAVLHIRTTILDGLRALDPVSRTLRQRRTQIEQARAELAQAQGSWPTEVAVAAAAGLTVAQLRHCQQQTSRVSVSLDEATDDGGTDFARSWQEVLADDDPEVDPAAVVDRRALRQLVRDAVALLPERERVVVAAVYGEGVPPRVVAERLGVSESRISQLRDRALKRLRGLVRTALDLTETEGLVA